MLTAQCTREGNSDSRKEGDRIRCQRTLEPDEDPETEVMRKRPPGASVARRRFRDDRGDPREENSKCAAYGEIGTLAWRWCFTTNTAQFSCSLSWCDVSEDIFVLITDRSWRSCRRTNTQTKTRPRRGMSVWNWYCTGRLTFITMAGLPRRQTSQGREADLSWVTPQWLKNPLLE